MKKKKAVPTAVSEYMASLAHKANAVLKGTSTAHDRASKASKARWAKYRAQKEAKPQGKSDANAISQKSQNTKL
jgi:hypothetical protein